MKPQEAGFLLLTSQLGNPDRKVLTVAQFRLLASRVRSMAAPSEERDLTQEDLKQLGFGQELSQRIVSLLDEKALLEYYIHRGRKAGCLPISRIGADYPPLLRKRLGMDGPGCLWAKGDLSLLKMPGIALVGSRDLSGQNRAFARKAGEQAARQGFALVSGNARGADRAAQSACLEAGGCVISVVADELWRQPLVERCLYLSEDCFDGAFSSQRALSRNRVIHALGRLTLVAQSSLRKGGSWDGTVKNLRFGWSPVFCFDDGSPAAAELGRMGAALIGVDALESFDRLYETAWSLLDQ